MAVLTYDDPAVTYDDASYTYGGSGYLFDDIHVTVEMAFGFAPLSTDPDWVPVTDYVRGVDVSRGRNSEFTTYGPGTASLRLDNRDRRFDPEYTSGPFYGDLVPMVPVRITATRAGTVYTVFYGFVTGWPTAYNTANTDAVASVNCVDGTRLLGNTRLNPAFYNTVVTEPSFSLYYPLQEWVAVPYTSGGLPKELVGSYPTSGGVPVRTGSSLVEFDGYFPVEQSSMITAESFSVAHQTAVSGEAFTTPAIRTIEFFIANNTNAGTVTAFDLIADGTATGSIISFDFDLNSSGQITDFLFRNYADGIEVNPASLTPFTIISQDNIGAHVVVTNDTAEVRFYVDGQLVATEAKTSTISPSGSGNGNLTQLSLATDMYWSNLAFYGDTFVLADVERHYEASRGFLDDLTNARLGRILDAAGWPTGWRDLDTGVQSVATLLEGNTMDRVRQIGDAEQGAVFVNREGNVEFVNRTVSDAVSVTALFDDAGTDLPFTGVQVDSNTVDAIRNRVETRFRTGTVVVSDAASIAAYGESSQSLDLSLIDDQATAEAIGGVVLARGKDPRTRIRQLQVTLRADTANLLPVLAQLELADDVTVSFTPTGVGDELWRAVRVQGVSHSITPERWDCQLYLAPGPIGTNGPLVVLDDDTYGKLSDGNKLG